MGTDAPPRGRPIMWVPHRFRGGEIQPHPFRSLPLYRHRVISPSRFASHTNRHYPVGHQHTESTTKAKLNHLPMGARNFCHLVSQWDGNRQGEPRKWEGEAPGEPNGVRHIAAQQELRPPMMPGDKTFLHPSVLREELCQRWYLGAAMLGYVSVKGIMSHGIG